MLLNLFFVTVSTLKTFSAWGNNKFMMMGMDNTGYEVFNAAWSTVLHFTERGNSLISQG